MTVPGCCDRFNRRAALYERHARLQRGLAWRLAHHIARLPLPPGPRADLGAGTGLVGQALRLQAPQLELLQLDGSAELLTRNPLAGSGRGVRWDLEAGLPATLQHCGLLSSSCALHWLQNPAAQLQQWATALAPGGWLALTVPVEGCFPQWHQAARAAQVPCTAQPLPKAARLIDTAANLLNLRVSRTLTFSRPYPAGGRGFLRQLRLVGADYSDHAPLQPAEWRRLLAHWPDDPCVSWTILLLIGSRAHQR
jgi:malonyl-CoA O-methyltransferase